MSSTGLARQYIFRNLLITFTAQGRREVKLKKDDKVGDKDDYNATARAIAQLGLDGWQLVGGDAGSGGGSPYFNTLLFQRIIP